MSDTTTPSPKLRRIDLAYAIYRKIRCEKNPPIARYTAVLALARARGPLTSLEIGVAIGETVSVSGTVDAAERAGLFLPSTPAANGSRRWRLSPKGEALAASLINPEIP